MRSHNESDIPQISNSNNILFLFINSLKHPYNTMLTLYSLRSFPVFFFLPYSSIASSHDNFMIFFFFFYGEKRKTIHFSSNTVENISLLYLTKVSSSSLSAVLCTFSGCCQVFETWCQVSHVSCENWMNILQTRFWLHYSKFFLSLMLPHSPWPCTSGAGGRWDFPKPFLRTASNYLTRRSNCGLYKISQETPIKCFMYLIPLNRMLRTSSVTLQKALCDGGDARRERVFTGWS